MDNCEVKKEGNTQPGSEQQNLIEVNMAEMRLAKAPAVLITRGLGSCLGITFYDSTKKIGALAHPMLPDIQKAKVKSNPHRFVNSVIEAMLKDMKRMGALRANIEAKLFGGAHMFSFIGEDSMLNIGKKNIEMARILLKEQSIKIGAEELGGSFGRTVTFDVSTGKVRVRTISLGEKEV